MTLFQEQLASLEKRIAALEAGGGGGTDLSDVKARLDALEQLYFLLYLGITYVGWGDSWTKSERLKAEDPVGVAGNLQVLKATAILYDGVPGDALAPFDENNPYANTSQVLTKNDFENWFGPWADWWGSAEAVAINGWPALPVGPAGPVSIGLQHPLGDITVGTVERYIPPSIYSVTPLSGSFTTRLTVTGEQFLQIEPDVTFFMLTAPTVGSLTLYAISDNPYQSMNAEVIDDNTLTMDLSALKYNYFPGDTFAVTAHGQQSDTGGTYTVSAPAIISNSPTTGTAGTPTSVTLTGNFDDVFPGSTVRAQGPTNVNATNVVIVNDTTITFNITIPTAGQSYVFQILYSGSPYGSGGTFST